MFIESQKRGTFCVYYHLIVRAMPLTALFKPFKVAISNVSLKWINHCTMGSIVKLYLAPLYCLRFHLSLWATWAYISHEASFAFICPSLTILALSIAFIYGKSPLASSNASPCPSNIWGFPCIDVSLLVLCANRFKGIS